MVSLIEFTYFFWWCYALNCYFCYGYLKFINSILVDHYEKKNFTSLCISRWCC